MTVFDYVKKWCGFCMSYCGSHGGVGDDAAWNSKSNQSTPVPRIDRNASFLRHSSSSIDISRRPDGNGFQGSFLYSGPSSANLHSRQSTPCFSPYQAAPPILNRVPSMSDASFTMPEMNTNSAIITPYQVSALFLTFPPRLRLYPWTLLYSLKRDGCSLANLYSRLEKYEHTILMVISDTKRTIFGAVLSPPNLKQRGKSFYGTCETFVFTFYPRLQKYTASGENNYFIMCMSDGITIGGWLPALWLDSNLERGATNHSGTFDNLPLTDETFKVKDIECWALAEPEYMEEMHAIVGSAPIYKQFDSSLLAEKKPEKEVGGVRCGRKARLYQPRFKPEASASKMFQVGEESEEEDEGDDVFDQGDCFHTPDRNENCRGMQGNRLQVDKPRMHGGSTRSPFMAAVWSERYR